MIREVFKKNETLDIVQSWPDPLPPISLDTKIQNDQMSLTPYPPKKSIFGCFMLKHMFQWYLITLG